MWWPAVGIFRLSHAERELEAHHLALGRAAIALGRKVLADNPRPNVRTLAQLETNKLPLQQPHRDKMRMAVDQAKAKRERRSLERQHLLMAEGHVTKAERVIREQVAIIESLRCDGHDTTLAEQTLRIFEANLQVMREHRELIIRAIEEADDGR